MAGRPTAPLASASGHWLWAGGLCRLSSSFDFLLFLFSARRDRSSCLRRSRRSPPSALPLVCHREVDFIRSFCGHLRARALSRGPGAGTGPARGARVPRQAVVAVWESTPRASCSERTPLPRPHSGCCPHHSACLLVPTSSLRWPPQAHPGPRCPLGTFTKGDFPTSLHWSLELEPMTAQRSLSFPNCKNGKRMRT